MTTQNATATLVHLDDGTMVRVTETVEEIVNMLDDGSNSDWFYAADPGDNRQFAIRASRVTWVEEGAQDA